MDNTKTILLRHLDHYILITNLMHWLLFIHKILFSSTCFEPQLLIFRRIQLSTCSIWYCHSLWEFLVACWYIAWVRTDCRGKVVGGCLKTLAINCTMQGCMLAVHYRVSFQLLSLQYIDTWRKTYKRQGSLWTHDTHSKLSPSN